MPPVKPLAALLLALLLPPPVPPERETVPPPPPRRDEPKDAGEGAKEGAPEEAPDPAYMTLLPDDGSPWGLAPDLASRLAKVADTYLDYAVRFTCTETARSARFANGEADKETRREYGYLLIRGERGAIEEYRQKMRKDGTVTDAIVNDAEAFPPAYAWVFLFAKLNQPYFAYRERGDRFEGYDWVRVFEFKGAVPYTDGRDIRQWDGVALVDATTLTPVEIRAEPSRQAERLKVLFERWAQSFNIVGYRVGARPIGFSGRVIFQTRKDGLTFPTEMRYTTFRAVSAKRTEPQDASIRDYSDYRFFRTATDQKTGPVKP